MEIENIQKPRRGGVRKPTSQNWEAYSKFTLKPLSPSQISWEPFDFSPT